jgi:hypothetical protein
VYAQKRTFVGSVRPYVVISAPKLSLQNEGNMTKDLLSCSPVLSQHATCYRNNLALLSQQGFVILQWCRINRSSSGDMRLSAMGCQIERRTLS